MSGDLSPFENGALALRGLSGATKAQERAAARHPRTIGWIGTAALAMGGSNQSLFLIAALFAGQGDIPGQGSAAVLLLILGPFLVLPLRLAGPSWC